LLVLNYDVIVIVVHWLLMTLLYDIDDYCDCCCIVIVVEMICVIYYCNFVIEIYWRVLLLLLLIVVIVCYLLLWSDVVVVIDGCYYCLNWRIVLSYSTTDRYCIVLMMYCYLWHYCNLVDCMDVIWFIVTFIVVD